MKAWWTSLKKGLYRACAEKLWWGNLRNWQAFKDWDTLCYLSICFFVDKTKTQSRNEFGHCKTWGLCLQRRWWKALVSMNSVSSHRISWGPGSFLAMQHHGLLLLLFRWLKKIYFTQWFIILVLQLRRGESSACLGTVCNEKIRGTES